MSIASWAHVKKINATKCNVGIKMKRHATTNRRVKQTRSLRDDMVCERRERIKKAQRGDKRDSNNSSAQGLWLYRSVVFSNTFFTCSGGEFCPGLGEEELDEVAAAGLVGLCCFAREEKEQEISLN